MERSRRATNPDNYEAVDVVRHGKKKKSFKVKSGRLQWRFSKRYESLRAELAEIFRLSAATRKREHGEVCNWLLGHAGSIIVEDNSFKAFQKGHFGKSIGRHAPAAFYTQLTSKAESAGLQVTVVSPRKLKPSQHNLLTDTFVKHELWERRVRLGNDDDDRWIDRDAAACLNLLYADLEKQTYAPERIREAVLAGVTAWLESFKPEKGSPSASSGGSDGGGFRPLPYKGCVSKDFVVGVTANRGQPRGEKPRLNRNPPTSVARLFSETHISRALHRHTIPLWEPN